MRIEQIGNWKTKVETEEEQQFDFPAGTENEPLFQL